MARKSARIAQSSFYFIDLCLVTDSLIDSPVGEIAMRTDARVHLGRAPDDHPGAASNRTLRVLLL